MFKKDTIKWKIFKYNLFVIAILIGLVSIIFNLVINMYLENDIISQLDKISSHTVKTFLHQPPPLRNRLKKPASLPVDNIRINSEKDFVYYFMLNRSLKEPLSLLNAEYILLDKEGNLVTPIPGMYPEDSCHLLNQIVYKVKKSSNNFSSQEHLKLNISGTNYIAVVKRLSSERDTGLGWIIIYSSLQKINQLQFRINVILLIILFVSSMITLLLASNLTKKLSMTLYSLNKHIKALAERDFGNQIKMPVYDELREIVNSINVMSEKLGTYDKAQKTFLQNVSHEFRTPLMSIQSYAEGIKYNVVDSGTAVDIILDESKRMTHLLEELLYLSRLNTIEENYHFKKLNFRMFINGTIERFTAIALKNNISIIQNDLNDKIEITADEEKLSQAITNIISNCVRYAKTTVTLETEILKNNILQLSIYDDGPGFESDDLPHIFERFYKGKKGNWGLGLAISKDIIEKHNGTIAAKNNDSGGALFIIELTI